MRGRIEPALGELALDSLQKTFEQGDIEGFGQHAHVHMPCPIEFFRIAGDENDGQSGIERPDCLGQIDAVQAPGI